MAMSSDSIRMATRKTSIVRNERKTGNGNKPPSSTLTGGDVDSRDGQFRQVAEKALTRPICGAFKTLRKFSITPLDARARTPISPLFRRRGLSGEKDFWGRGGG